MEATESSGSTFEDKVNSSMNISSKHRKEKGQRRKYSASEIFVSLEQMVSVRTDLISIVKLHHKGRMSIGKCIDELLLSGHVEEGNDLHMLALWFLRDKKNRNSYCATKRL